MGDRGAMQRVNDRFIQIEGFNIFMEVLEIMANKFTKSVLERQAKEMKARSSKPAEEGIRPAIPPQAALRPRSRIRRDDPAGCFTCAPEVWSGIQTSVALEPKTPHTLGPNGCCLNASDRKQTGVAVHIRLSIRLYIHKASGDFSDLRTGLRAAASVSRPTAAGGS